MPTATAAPSDTRSDTTSDTAALLLAAGQGDQSAWEEIVLRYGNLVSATVRSFRLQDADVLDAIQMTWVRLLTNWHKVRDPNRLSGWLATTARRECLSILYQANTRAANHTEAVVDRIPEPSMDPEQRLLAAETRQELHTLLAELPLRRQALLRALFTDSPQPYAEIASSAGIPVGSVGPTRVRALQQLRRMLDERGWGPGVSA